MPIAYKNRLNTRVFISYHITQSQMKQWQINNVFVSLHPYCFFNFTLWNYFKTEVIKKKSHKSWWRKHFPRCWPFVRGIHLSPVNSPYKGQWRGTLMFSLICAWINDWVNNGETGDLRRHRAHYDVIVMYIMLHIFQTPKSNLTQICLRILWIHWLTSATSNPWTAQLTNRQH